MGNENSTYIGLKLISSKDLIDSSCFDVMRSVGVIEDALLAYKRGRIIMPDKISQIIDPTDQKRINSMPATLLDKSVSGIKHVSVFPGNPQTYSRSTVCAVIVLNELAMGFPIAIMNGTFITAFRTACVSAIASKYLAKKKCRTIGIIGSGEQAKAHLLAIRTMHPEISVCKVASRNPEHERQFIDVMGAIIPDLVFIACNSDYDAA